MNKGFSLTAGFYPDPQPNLMGTSLSVRNDPGTKYRLAAYGYDPNLAKGAQSFRAETGILIAWALPTGCLLMLCFLALRWYPLSGPSWEQIKRRLSARHVEKERRYLGQLLVNEKMIKKQEI